MMYCAVRHDLRLFFVDALTQDEDIL